MRYIVEIDIGLENAREIVWTMNHPEYFEGYRPDSPKNSYYLICYGVDDQLCDKANGSKTGYSPLSTQEDETYTHEL